MPLGFFWIAYDISKPKSFERIDNSYRSNWDISQAVTFNLLFARHIELAPYPQAKSRATPFFGKRCWLKLSPAEKAFNSLILIESLHF